MTKESIFEVIREAIVEMLPDIEMNEIRQEMSLKELGANSVDRMDIIIRAMELINIKIPLIEFGELNSIQDIINLLFLKSNILR